MRINKYSFYYECIFIDGSNLLTFSFLEMMQQLKSIYNIDIELFTFNLN